MLTCPHFGTIRECRGPSLCLARDCRAYFCQGVPRKEDRFIIGWTKDCGFPGVVSLHRAPAALPRVARYLFQNEQGETMMLHEHPKATRFTRAEADRVILAFWELGSKAWNAPGGDFFPIVLEDLSA